MADDRDCVDLEPFFYDEAATVAEAAAAAERGERERQERAREREAAAKRWAAHEAVLESIREYDPDEKRYIYTRYHFEADMSDFDLDEVSDISPMRFTATQYKPPAKARRFLCKMINVLAVRIIPPSYFYSDDGDHASFPISVYGSVIARDNIDLKCVPLFHRSRDDPQLIAAEDELSLILTGPHRGLVLFDAIYIEIDLKMKMDDRQGSREDKRLSKGMLILNGVQLSPYLSKMRTAVQSLTLPSSSIRPCTAQITYAYVSHAVEATISVELLRYQGQAGHFCGQITACTSTIQDTSVVLHDSKLLSAGGVMAADGNEHTIPLLRRVMSVSLDEMLIVTIVAQPGYGVTSYSKRIVDFTPAVNGGDEAQIICGVTSLRVKVNWSLMNPVIAKQRLIGRQ